jgi:hypothetical protein
VGGLQRIAAGEATFLDWLYLVSKVIAWHCIFVGAAAAMIHLAIIDSMTPVKNPGRQRTAARLIS